MIIQTKLHEIGCRKWRISVPRKTAISQPGQRQKCSDSQLGHNDASVVLGPECLLHRRGPCDEATAEKVSFPPFLAIGAIAAKSQFSTNSHCFSCVGGSRQLPLDFMHNLSGTVSRNDALSPAFGPNFRALPSTTGAFVGANMQWRLVWQNMPQSNSKTNLSERQSNRDAGARHNHHKPSGIS